MTTLIEVINHDRIRELRLAKPPVNALDRSLCQSLAAAIRQAAADQVDGLLLSGGERIFSAGMDVPQLLAHGDDRSAVLATWSAFFDVAIALAGSPIPVAAALHGHAPAGGCVLALCCDYRVMARSVESARPYMIGLNEVQVGLTAPEGIQRLLRRVVGAYRAERLLVSGELISAEHALDIGLIDVLAAGAEVTTQALSWLHKLLALPRQPMLRTRAIARSDLLAALQPELIDLEHFIDDWYGPDTQRALQALSEKLKK